MVAVGYVRYPDKRVRVDAPSARRLHPQGRFTDTDPLYEALRQGSYSELTRFTDTGPL